MNKLLFALFLALFSCKKENLKVSVPLTEFPTKEFLTGQVDYSKDKNFIKVSEGKFAVQDIWLPKEVLGMFLAMRHHAHKDGVNLKLLSGARNYEHQVRVWNRRWKKNVKPLEATKDNLEFVAMPMTSRHHWGTDIDFWNISNNLDVGRKEYEWLNKHANGYGFFQVYSSKKSDLKRKGYKEEKWHWSYLPLACGYLQHYNEKVNIDEIQGFYGDEFAKDFDVIENYVNGLISEAKNC